MEGTDEQVGARTTPLRTAEYMAAEIDAVLALLRGPVVEEPDFLSSPDVKFEEPCQPDLTEDPINSSRVGADPNHQLRTTPTPLARESRDAVVGEAVFEVPEVRARVAGELDAKQAVVGNVSQLSAPFQQHLSLSRSANADARRSGTLAASIAYTLGQEGTTVMEASPVAIASRICSASLAARQGAVASAQPVEGDLDVIVAPLVDVGRAEDAYPDHFAVYLPTQLNDNLAACLLSLLVYGGPGAYRWRYRGDAAVNEKAGLMPSIVRWMHGGGANSILAVVEQARVLPAVGGAALTVQNLNGLEAFYRRHFGHAVFDAAWRTTFAAAAVYLTPAVEQDTNLRLGDNFVARRTSAVLGGVDLHGPQFHWNWDPDPPEGWSDLLPPQFHDFKNHAVQQRACKVGWALARHIDDGLPAGFVRWETEMGGARYYYVRVEPGGNRVEEHRFFEWEELFDEVLELGRDDALFFRAAYSHYANNRLIDLLDPGDRDNPADDVPAEWHFHNVYGAWDKTVPCLPSLRMNEAVGLIALFIRPAVIPGIRPALSAYTMRARARNYAAHLHLVNYYTYARNDLWPADLVQGAVLHAPYVRKLPDALKPWFWMDLLSVAEYDQQNWWLMESPYMIRGSNNYTAFAGFAVPGGWDVDKRGVVEVSKPTTNYAALEAAFRNGVSEGGTISASGRFGATRFDIIRGRNGMLNAMSFSPRIATLRGVEAVDLAADNGFNSLQTGANVSAGIIFSA